MADCNQLGRGGKMVETWGIPPEKFEEWDRRRPKLDVSLEDMSKVFGFTYADGEQGCEIAYLSMQ